MKQNEKFNQVLVVGAGAVGGFLGAHLAKHHPQISFLLRPRTLRAVQNHGLTVKSGTGTLTVHPPAASDPRDLPSPDLIILGIKTYDVQEVLAQIAPVVREDTVILTLQNGVTVENEVLARFHRDCVVGGVAFIYSKISEPGVIEHYKRGSVTIGEMMGHESLRVRGIAEMFKTAGVPCQISKDIRRAKWEKMCWNCVFNPLTVLLNDRVSKVLDQQEMAQVISAIVEEVVAVAIHHRVPLEEGMADKVVKWSQDIRDIHTSMYDDWKAGRSTEIDDLNGYIVKEGQAHGIPTPVNMALAALIRVITKRERSHDGQLRIEGKVLQPLTLDMEGLANFPGVYHVPDVSVMASGMAGVGIRVQGLLDMATPHVEADHVTFHAGDGQFAATLTLNQARQYAIVIYERDGKPLGVHKGGPFRIVAPGLGDLCANVKNVERIEITKGPGKDTRPSVKTCGGE